MDKEEIKRIRTNLGMTQEGFAYALGTTCGSVNRWEAGKNKPSRIWIIQIRKLRDSYGS